MQYVIDNPILLKSIVRLYASYFDNQNQPNLDGIQTCIRQSFVNTPRQDSSNDIPVYSSRRNDQLGRLQNNCISDSRFSLW